ncbi:hypothetical protein IM043_gp251 [Bacillus phage SPG24]|nr:hypothetical protein IM043_gp251 [Bacillus phage SPG24]
MGVVQEQSSVSAILSEVTWLCHTV